MTRPGLRSEAMRRLGPLIKSGLVVGVSVLRIDLKSGGRLQVVTSVQTRVNAPDFNVAKYESALRQIKATLKNLDFDIRTVLD